MLYVKVYKYKKQYSSDGGYTWIDVVPAEYVPSGAPISYSETLEECIYSTTKYILELSDSNYISAECDSTRTISQSEISAYSASVVSAEIGSCVNTIGDEAFRGCSGLTSCTLSSGITSISNYIFYGCSALTDVIIPDGVTSIGNYAFRSCKGFRNITIPQNVTTIGNMAFRACSNLNSITCLATTPPSLGNGAFADTNDCTIYVPANSVASYQSAWSAYSSRIQAIT